MPLERMKIRQQARAPNKSEEFEFILAEYEGIFTLIQINYATSEKIMQALLLILGFLASVIAWRNDGNHSFDIFNLESPLPHICLVVAIIGFLLFMMAVEHRLKVIYYVRCLNSIRAEMKSRFKWDMVPTLLPTSIRLPPYCAWGKDFFWELLAFSALNSFALAASVISFWNNGKTSAFTYGMGPFAFVVGIVVIMHIAVFKTRARLQDSTQPNKEN